MKRDDIIRMAQEAGERVASLIAAAEREARAKRGWIDLTPTEIKILRRAATNDRQFAELVQAKIKEKNNG